MKNPTYLESLWGGMSKYLKPARSIYRLAGILRLWISSTSGGWKDVS